MNRVIQYYNLVTRIYYGELCSNKEAYDYLTGRGISRKVIDSMLVGYAPNKNCLPITEKWILNDSHLFYEDRSNVFNKAIVFPCIVNGNTVFFSSRKLDKYTNGDKTKKHLHLKGSISFVYNQDVINKSDRIFMSEGCIDTLSLLTHNRPSVGLLGANRMNDQIASTMRGKTVYIVMDSDVNGSGQKASVRNAAILSRNKVNTRIVLFPDEGYSYDINDFLLHHSIEELDYLVKYSIPFEKTQSYIDGDFQSRGTLISSNLDICRVIKHYCFKIIQKNTKGYKIHCPLPDHIDDAASMQIYKETNTCYCFGCNKFLDSIGLIRKLEKVDGNKAKEIYSQL